MRLFKPWRTSGGGQEPLLRKFFFRKELDRFHTAPLWVRSRYNPAPMSPVRRDQFCCTVRENFALCREHWRLVLACQGFPPTAPGQFIQIACNRPEVSDSGAFLRRPFSLARRHDNDREAVLEVIHRVVGVGTYFLSQLKGGD